jgi:hypothetical protein
LTGLCLERKISISYTQCLPGVNNHNILNDGTLIKNNPYEGLIDFISEDIFLAVSLGYQDMSVNEHDRLARHTNVGEHKPRAEDVIHWQKI